MPEPMFRSDAVSILQQMLVLQAYDVNFQRYNFQITPCGDKGFCVVALKSSSISKQHRWPVYGEGFFVDPVTAAIGEQIPSSFIAFEEQTLTYRW
ncbi:MAG: hypothetical protein KBC87_02020 [Candidatus Pacebacteria bacterium]|nr:hypothetical protein [Candidatus Paceibacterota bacterium]